MLVITKNTSAQWRLANWCQQQRLAALPRTLDGALAAQEPRSWSVIADPGFPALIRGIQAFALKHERARRPLVVFVGTQRTRADEVEQRGSSKIHPASESSKVTALPTPIYTPTKADS